MVAPLVEFSSVSSLGQKNSGSYAPIEQSLPRQKEKVGNVNYRWVRSVNEGSFYYYHVCTTGISNVHNLSVT
jgi:hypothetical protein